MNSSVLVLHYFTCCSCAASALRIPAALLTLGCTACGGDDAGSLANMQQQQPGPQQFVCGDSLTTGGEAALGAAHTTHFEHRLPGNTLFLECIARHESRLCSNVGPVQFHGRHAAWSTETLMATVADVQYHMQGSAGSFVCVCVCVCVCICTSKCWVVYRALQEVFLDQECSQDMLRQQQQLCQVSTHI
jgi:hypothetical protein